MICASLFLMVESASAQPPFGPPRSNQYFYDDDTGMNNNLYGLVCFVLFCLMLGLALYLCTAPAVFYGDQPSSWYSNGVPQVVNVRILSNPNERARPEHTQ